MAISNKVSEAQRRQMIAEAAYFRAERRGFVGGDPTADWIEAEAEVGERVRKIENAHLIAHLEEGLAAATKRIDLLKKKVSSAATEARGEWRADVEKLGKLRDALRAKVDDFRAQGEQTGHKARQQAEKIWDEINHTMQRVAERVRH